MEKIYLVFINEELHREIAGEGMDILLDDEIGYSATYHAIEENNKQHILTAMQLANINYEYYILTKDEYKKYSGLVEV